MSTEEPEAKKARQHQMDAGTSSSQFQVTVKNGSNGLHREKLPERWLYCPPAGKLVFGVFLPLKTPLDTSYDALVGDPKYRFHPQMALTTNLIGGEEGAKIGLWIDLTNTKNYYDKTEVEKAGCVYKKLRLVGHGESPSREQTYEFIKIVKEHRQNSKDIIAVHCTHGFNRTGFLIAAYLFEEEGMEIGMAVSEFARCRPDGIYKQRYLDDLIKRYGDDDEIMAPGRPKWENGPIADDMYYGELGQPSNSQKNGDSTTDLINPSSSSSADKISADDQSFPKFMEGKIPEVTFVRSLEERKYLQLKIRQYCGYEKNDFPGSQPVSLEKEKNLHLLATQEYMVSWKADGLRYMILIESQNQVYAFDRDNNPFNIPRIVFPRSQVDERQIGSDHLRDTLLDAEMVMDRLQKPDRTFEEIPRLLIYDIVTWQGVNVSQKPFPERLHMIEKEIILPRTQAFKTGKFLRENELFSVRKKDFFHIIYTHKLLNRNFGIAHEVDGLIFQPSKPYTAGRFDELLKWKPPEHSTVDFKLIICKVEKRGCLTEFVANLYVMGRDEQPFARIPGTKVLQAYHNKIVECRYDLQKGCWEMVRERTDKSHPNAIHTAESVCRTIRNPITKDVLLAFISHHGYRVRQELERSKAPPSHK